MRFINWWKEPCSALLKTTSYMRKKIAKEIEILDDEISSRYEKIHGVNGLYHNLVELFNAMAELRIIMEYGDYLVYICTTLKEDNINDMK